MKNISNEKILHSKKDEVEYIQFRKLLEYQDSLTHVFTLKSNLNFIGESYLESQKKICDILGLDIKNSIVPNQTHSDVVEIVEGRDIKLDNVDGVITNEKNLILYTRVADCIALILFDPIKKVIGNIHSGWRGTIQEISKKAVLKMVNKYDSSPEDIICGIFPSIQECCFEVYEDIKDLFEDKFSKIDGIIRQGDIEDNKQKYFINTVKINKHILTELGIKEENILDSKLCTLCNSEKLHSYRGDGKESGRSASIISLK